MEKGVRSYSTIMELTTKFVDVPIRVRVPPKIAAYERGSRSLVGLILKRWHRSMARGIKIATAAVLLMNPEIIETVSRKINMVSHFLLPPFLARKSANTSKKPVFTSALLIINIAPMVMTAGLLNPLIASCQDIISKKRSTPTAPIATTSIGKVSMINNTTIANRTKIRIDIFNVTILDLQLLVLILVYKIIHIVF